MNLKPAACAVFGLFLTAGSAAAQVTELSTEQQKVSYALGLDAAAQVTELSTEQQKVSYALGLDLGTYFKGLGEDFDLAAIHQGVKDSYTGGKTLLTPEEAAEIQKEFAIAQQRKEVRKREEMNTANREAAEKFLQENKGKEGIKTTDSGLQYKVIKEGSGEKPKVSDTVKVNYKGTLLDGTEFDSSYKRGEPAVFRADQVIAGWTEALQLMTVGSRYELFLTPDLAYGDRGAPPAIQPGSLLIFEVELLEIVKSVENKAAEEDK